MAAVLACGDGTAASGVTAGALWGLTEARSRTIHVIAPARLAAADVELDGHGTRYARTDLQKHSRRQNEVVLGLPGWTLLRFTRDDVFDDWPYVQTTLRHALGA